MYYSCLLIFLGTLSALWFANESDQVGSKLGLGRRDGGENYETADTADKQMQLN